MGRKLIMNFVFDDMGERSEEDLARLMEVRLKKFGYTYCDWCWDKTLEEESEEEFAEELKRIARGHGDEPDDGDLDPGKKVSFIIDTSLNFPGPYQSYVLRNMKSWWEMVVDCEWADLGVKEINQQLMAFTEYFRQATRELFEAERHIWIQFHVITARLEVSYDSDDEREFRRACTVFNEMWLKHVEPRL